MDRSDLGAKLPQFLTTLPKQDKIGFLPFSPVVSIQCLGPTAMLEIDAERSLGKGLSPMRRKLNKLQPKSMLPVNNENGS